MIPNVVHSRAGIQLSFDLDHQLSDASIYPRSSPNGSTLIICAHEDGLELVWYGGQRLKQTTTPKINGSSIDLTAEDDCNADSEAPQYEEEEQEIDPLRPFYDVVWHDNVSLGTAVTKLAFPPLTRDGSDDFPALLSSHAILVVACADLSLRLLAIPLNPGRKIETHLQQVIINGVNSHQDLISSVAVTLTGTSIDGGDQQERNLKSHSRDNNLVEAETTTAKLNHWSLLIASTSPTGTGLLLIHESSIEGGTSFSNVVDDCVPIQREFLRCGLAKCTIEFNPSMYPSKRHAQLLIAPADGNPSRVYQALPDSAPVKKRRGSTATSSSMGSVTPTGRRASSDCRVLINLHTPFSQLEDNLHIPRRKSVIAAKWVLRGRGVVVLLEDGGWGIWDIEAAGPASSASIANPVKARSNISGIQGGSVAQFALRGMVESSPATRQASGNHSTATSSLAPMTPKTRKERAQGLFEVQPQSSLAANTMPTRGRHGKIAVSTHSQGGGSFNAQDESIIFSYGSRNVFISSLRTHWQSAGTDSDSSGGPTTVKAVPLPQLRLANQILLNIDLIGQSSTQHEQSLNHSRAAPNFMVATYSRIVLFMAPLSDGRLQTLPPLTSHIASTTSLANKDQMLLDSGELDIDGMDRILNNMNGAASFSGTQVNGFTIGIGRKSVNFQFDQDDDVDMDTSTPTISKGSRSRLTVQDNSIRREGATRLFS